jgi:UDP-glucose 4-epimerase
VHGDGLQSRDFTYISDAVAAVVAASTAPAEVCSGKVYNVAGGQAHTLVDLLAFLGQILGLEARVVHTNPRPGDVRHTQADISAAANDLGHRPVVNFEQGLRQTVAWFDERVETDDHGTR